MEKPSYDAELEELLRSREQWDYRLEPLQAEKDALVTALRDHVKDMPLQLVSSEDVYGIQKRILTYMVEKDIPQYKDAFLGEIQVANAGLVMLTDESGDVVYDKAGPDDQFRGTMEGFVLTTVPFYDEIETFLRDEDGKMDEREGNPWGLSVLLQGVSHSTPGGFIEQKLEGSLVVPLIYPGIELHKIVRNANFTTQAHERYELHDVTDIFRGESVRVAFSDIENDLNYNGYHEVHIDAIRARCQARLQETWLYSGDTSSFRLTCANAQPLRGEPVSYIHKEVRYNQPTLIRRDGLWRVVHDFTTQGMSIDSTVQVLPEDIKAVALCLPRLI